MSNFELEENFREWWGAQGYVAKPNSHTVNIATAWASTLLPPEPAGADGPAVPESREPASVTGQPSDEELLQLALDTRLYRFQATAGDPVQYELTEAQINAFARAVLARWGTPNQAEIGSLLGDAPTPVPLEGEVGELISVIESCAGFTDESTLVGEVWAKIVALLEQRHPAPVPVSERLPEPEDCDAEGRYWRLINGCEAWVLGKGNPSALNITHWLPATALPLPQGEVK